LNFNTSALFFYVEGSREVIVCINDEEIGCGFIPPLKSRIHIDILLLVVVLQKCCEEERIGKRNIDPGSHQPESGFVPGSDHGDVVITRTYSGTYIRLETITQVST